MYVSTVDLRNLSTIEFNDKLISTYTYKALFNFVLIETNKGDTHTHMYTLCVGNQSIVDNIVFSNPILGLIWQNFSFF